MHIDLTLLPEPVRESAYMLANAEGEVLHGWKAITKQVSDNPSLVQPVRYLIVTDKGLYESLPNGVFVRASVLHKF